MKNILDPPKLFIVITTPWRKYSHFFDKGCRGIWGFSPLLKYTFLYFVVFILASVFGVVKHGQDSTVASIFLMIFILGFVAIAFVWFIYLPILALIILFRTLKKINNSLNQLLSFWEESPWEMTPRRLYTQPHSSFFLYFIYAKNNFIDFIDWRTQFYPFNLINRFGVRYPLTMKLRHNSRHIEGLIADMDVPLKFVSYEINMQNTMYKFKFYEKVRNLQKVILKLENGFKKTGYYILEENGQINIIDPHAQQD